MKWCGFKGIKSRIITTMMIFTFLLSYTSAPVFAAGVQVENHYSDKSGKKQVSGLTIDGVRAPVTGQRLDDSAVVHTKEGHQWEIAVVWINDKQQVATKALAGEKYIPTLAFYVPSGYVLSGNAFEVEVSDGLTGLMGSSRLASVYDASRGITFIIPITAVGAARSADKLGNELKEAKDLTYQEWLQSSAATGTTDETSEVVSSSDGSNSEDTDSEDTDGEDGDTSEPEERSIVDIYCAQTARDALTDDDLETIIDLVINKLEPQAVELLKQSFPAFKEASENGEIGEEIGLYIYYKKGDKDGLEEHNTPKEALAYVTGREKDTDGELKYTYMIGVDLDSLIQKDKDGNPVSNPKTGRYRLLFEGKDMETFTNTIVHEMFHAFMDDYNRAGMTGATNLEDMVYNEKGEFKTKEIADRYSALHFPTWFIEGTASTVENVYEFRYDSFTAYRQQADSKEFYDKYTKDSILNNYVSNSNKTYLNLRYTYGYDENDKEIEAANANYVTGYLASLYLADLAYKAHSGAKKTGDENGFDSATFRDGLSYILKRLHDGETLDSVINDISPVDKDGKKVYKDTTAFQETFISGKADKKGYYYGEDTSLTFVTDYLNYMRSMESESGGTRKVPNGSIIFDFDLDYSEPIDPNREATSDFYKIVRSNVSIPSTVKNDTTQIGGAKSELNNQNNVGSGKLKTAARQKQAESKAVASTSNVQDTSTGKSIDVSSLQTVDNKTAVSASAAKDIPEDAAEKKEGTACALTSSNIAAGTTDKIKESEEHEVNEALSEKAGEVAGTAAEEDSSKEQPGIAADEEISEEQPGPAAEKEISKEQSGTAADGEIPKVQSGTAADGMTSEVQSGSDVQGDVATGLAESAADGTSSEASAEDVDEGKEAGESTVTPAEGKEKAAGDSGENSEDEVTDTVSDDTAEGSEDASTEDNTVEGTTGPASADGTAEGSDAAAESTTTEGSEDTSSDENESAKSAGASTAITESDDSETSTDTDDAAEQNDGQTPALLPESQDEEDAEGSAGQDKPADVVNPEGAEG